jgi:hypothetical protein
MKSGYIWAALITAVTFVAFDVVIAKGMFDLGFPSHLEEEDLQRSPAPYIGFKGKEGALDHDRWGYRWVHLPDSTYEITIAFFGGSTGYLGNPPIPVLLESELSKRLNRPVAISNFSVVSSNHRQHLHDIIESRSILKPDLILFYGGYNETEQTGFYDPRPGYPYNFYFRDETSAFWKFIFKYSASAGLLDKVLQSYFNVSITPISRLRSELKPFSPSWNKAITDKYFETLSYANTISKSFSAPHCRKMQFLGFYQPHQVTNADAFVHAEIRKRASESPFLVDVSDALDDLGKDVYQDIAHLKQYGNERMAKRLADEILRLSIFSQC